MIIIALNLVKQLECHGVTLFLELRKLWWTESTFLTSSQVRVNSLLIGLVKPSTASVYNISLETTTDRKTACSAVSHEL